MQTKRTLCIWVVGTFLLASFLMGCGGEPAMSPEDILRKSQEKLETLKSVMADVDMIQTTRTEEYIETSEISFNAEISIDGKTTPDFKLSGTINEDPIEGYGIGGIQYFNITDHGWIKVDSASSSFQIPGVESGFSTPEDFAEMWKYADDPEMESSKGESYIITFQVLGKDLLEGKYGKLLVDQLEENTDALQEYVSSELQGEYGQIVERELEYSLGPSYMTALLDSIKTSKTFFRVEIDKKSYYVVGTRVRTKTTLLEKDEFETSISSRFYDFNKPVSIQLPPEAENSEQMDVPFTPLTPLPR